MYGKYTGAFGITKRQQRCHKPTTQRNCIKPQRYCKETAKKPQRNRKETAKTAKKPQRPQRNCKETAKKLQRPQRNCNDKSFATKLQRNCMKTSWK